MTEFDSLAVLTGDFINSRTDPDTLERSMGAIEQIVTRFSDCFGLNLRFTRFRGDGWQVVITDPSQALTALVTITAGLTATQDTIQTRIALGFGAADSLGTQTLADAKGDAFIRSGHTLDNLSSRHIFAVDDTATDQQHAILALIEHISNGWTAKQAEAVAYALLHPEHSQDDIAKAFGISRQAIQLRLAAAGYSAIRRALYAFSPAR